MRRVSREKESSILHRLNHKTAHAGHALLQNLSFSELPSIRGQSNLELPPNLLVAPKRNILVGFALKVEATDVRSPHGEQSESAIMVGINQFFRRRRRLRQNAQPAKRILPHIFDKHSRWNAGTANSVEAVASGDKIATYFVGVPIL